MIVPRLPKHLLPYLSLYSFKGASLVVLSLAQVKMSKKVIKTVMDNVLTAKLFLLRIESCSESLGKTIIKDHFSSINRLPRAKFQFLRKVLFCETRHI